MVELQEEAFHSPVMVSEILKLLQVQPGKTYLDCTIGGGGHALQILQQSDPSGFVIGIDCDKEALKIAQGRLRQFARRIHLVEDNFVNLEKVLARLKVEKVDGVLLDLGLSKYQLVDESRGFSFKRDGPLDMRMARQGSVTASDLINRLSVKELTRIISVYGEERWAGQIAKAICAARKKKPLRNTLELARIVTQTIPPPHYPRKVHPATKTFQAFRIAVNKELENLEPAIVSAIGVLSPGGRVCVISYHSLEDRLVKQTFNRFARGCVCPSSLPACICKRETKIRILTKKPIRPEAIEVAKNPSARSAKLRSAERI
jgi:16S rRNA (cytosine1402-N4)-methyltransferase